MKVMEAKKCGHKEPAPGCLECANAIIIALRAPMAALDKHLRKKRPEVIVHLRKTKPRSNT